jgi:hypothetical protein
VSFTTTSSSGIGMNRTTSRNLARSIATDRLAEADRSRRQHSVDADSRVDGPRLAAATSRTAWAFRIRAVMFRSGRTARDHALD